MHDSIGPRDIAARGGEIRGAYHGPRTYARQRIAARRRVAPRQWDWM